MEKILTRAELYELVWARPVTKVAAELELSDVALLKICRKHRIPVPERGHWAKLAAGKPVRTTALPLVSNDRLNEIVIRGSALHRLPGPVHAAREQAIAQAALLASQREAVSRTANSPHFEWHCSPARIFDLETR